MENTYTIALLRGLALRSMALLACLLALTVQLRAQTVSTYAFTQGSGTYSSISGGTQLFDEGDNIDDETPVAVTIPVFWFAGAYHTTMYVTTNGFITFGAAPDNDEVTPLSGNDGYTAALSAFGADIEDASSGSNTEVRWQNTGGEIVVQWRDMERVISGNDEAFSFQIRMNTTTGVVRYIYSSVSSVENSTSRQPQVGLRGPNNTFATNVKNRLVNTNSGSNTWATSTNGTANSSTCRFTSGTTPPSGQTYTFTPPCAPPTAPNAGSNQTICLAPGSTTMAANNAAVGTGAWTQVSGTTATITTASSPTTTITGMTTSGTRTFRWTITSGSCSISDDVVITVNPTPSTSNAGADQTICATAGSAAMNAANPSTGTGAWTQAGGPVTANIANTSSRTTNITGMTTAGTYTFRWTVSNSPCAGSTDEISVIATAAPTTANAGVDQTMCISAGSTTLAANAPVAGTGAWSIASGSTSTSLSQFNSTTSPTTTFTPVSAGTYTLRWTVSNNPCTASTNDMVLTVRALPSASNAGADQTICSSPGTATMNANNPSSGTGAWSFISGPSTPSITTASSRTTPITGMTSAGTYIFQWTISNAPCASSSDQVSIVVNQTPNASASNNGPVCDASALNLNGTSNIGTTFSWTGPGGFNSASEDPSIASAVPANAGTYTFVATHNDCPSAPATTVVVVDNRPSVPVITPVSATICAGSSTGLSAASALAPVTYSGGELSFSLIGAASPYPSAITVSGFPVSGATVVSVTLNGVAHTNPDDIDMLLRSPSGTNVVLMSDVGGSGNISGNNYTLQDGASAMSDNGSIPSGTYAPTNSGASDDYASPGPGTVNQGSPALSMFTGNFNGTWNLYTRIDAFNIGGGGIDSWSITFNVPVTYAWSPASGLNATNVPAVMASPEGTTLYTVTATSAIGGCTRSADVTVNVVDQPNAGANSTLALCSTDAPANMGTLLGAHDAGAWSGPSAVVGDMYDPAIMLAGSYVYTVVAAPCANATATITVAESTATTWYADTDGDGAGDAAVSVIACAAPIGYVGNNSDLCVDNALKTGPGQCGCGVADTDSDADGTADCNDGCPNDANKTAPGICGCGAADTDSDSDGTADCNDGCPNDGNKTSPGTCGCGVADTDTDGDSTADCVDPCPLLAGAQNGDICDANPGPGYTLGTVIACACQPVACNNGLNVEFQTDGISDIGWELRQQGTNTLVQSGGGIYPPSPGYTENTCLPDGCFYLRVTDAGGDGITGGGYILRSQGKRIIDNRNNFTDGSVSAIANNEGFCLPLGNDRLIFVSCDRLDWMNNEYIVANDNPAVTAQWGVGNQADDGYEMWFFNPNGGYSFRRFHSHAVSDGFSPANASRACHIKVNNWAAGNHMQSNVLYNVRVRSRVNGSNSEWGTACRFKLDPLRAQCPLTKLMDIPGNQYYSCGATRNWGGGNYVHARPVSGANKYQFRFRIPAENFTVVRNSNNYFVQLNWGVSPLQACKTYQVDVRVSFDNGATWCTDFIAPPLTEAWGDMCMLTIACGAQGGGQNMAVDADHAQPARMTMYPNPNRGDQLYISMDAIEEHVRTMSVDIYDNFGKRVETRTIAVQDGVVNTVVDLNNGLAAGMYVVNVTAGNTTWTERLVVQP